MSRRGPVVTELDVSRFERATRAWLPLDYRRFLLATNGGLLADANRIARVRGTSVSVQVLYGLAPDLPWMDLEAAQANFPRIVPRRAAHLLPIGDDGEGIVLCVDLLGPECGKVSCAKLAEAPEAPRFVRLAESFRHFAERLMPAPGR